ncbi:right-handed parallel beta-helix repeat-containing protein [Maribellus maritimus]|uniref:right-handed parallel beta-helix repeat-containing protein n=1 Tax=Maribellus maritimus TaxID=2870838 RepID=UPI001EEB5BB4|nr:right-handed parallel beta-helix repeat-containing protein [Maribellus maritimus]MCG6187586.1 right-handed parallel beta-helix repeat-containing protein [Maribellus maritimus]
MFRKLLLLCLALFVFNCAIAKKYYVSTIGNNQNKGNLDSPFRTIQKGADLAQAGDTVLVMGGVYRERVSPVRGGSKQAPIVYIAEPGKRVFIKGSDVYTGKLKPEGNKVFSCSLSTMEFTDDCYFDNANPFKVPVASTPWERDGEPEGKEGIVFTLGQVFVNGEMYRQYPLKNEMKEHEASWWYNEEKNAVLIHFANKHQPKKSQIELTTRRRIFAPHQRGLGYIHVIGFIMEHCGNQYPRNFWETKENAQAGALSTRSGHHWSVMNNVVRYAANIGLDCGAEGPDNERINQRIYDPEEVIGNRIENNYILDNGCTGIIGWGSKEMVVKGNVVMYNNNQMYRGYKRYESAGIKFHNNIDCIVAENLVSDNFSYGIWFDNKYPNARVSKNVIVNNLRSGFFLEMGDYDFGTVLVDYNILMDNKENQIYIHDASGGLFVNNLIAGTRKMSNTGGTGPGRIKEAYGQAVYIRQVGSRTKTYHHSFYNNIFIDNDINYDINYPMWRSGEQRFLGNIYPEYQKGFYINSASDIPKPIDESYLAEKISKETGADVFGNDGRVELSLNQWQKFWELHSMHFDQDARKIENMKVCYIPEKHSVTMTIPEELKPRKNARWNENYKLRFDLRSESFPGPFGELETGSHSYIIYDGIPPGKRGELPCINIF